MSTTSIASNTEASNDRTRKRRLVWAGLAICGCVALCSLPLAMGLLGGGAIATAIASLVAPGIELVVAGVALVLALGVVGFRAYARRQRSMRAASAVATSIGRGCGC